MCFCCSFICQMCLPFSTQTPNDSCHHHPLDSTISGQLTICQSHSEKDQMESISKWTADQSNLPQFHWDILPTLTVQKSHERRRMMVTIQAMKLLLRISQNKYTKMAVARKKRWKNATSGCLQHRGWYMCISILIFIWKQWWWSDKSSSEQLTLNVTPLEW